MGVSKEEGKILFSLRKKVYSMTEEELDRYLKKLNLTRPKNGLSEDFLMEIYNKIRNETKITSKRCKPFGYGMRDLSVEKNHWVDDLRSTNFKITRPVIFCFPGNGGITSEKANGFCKLIERVLGLNHEVNPKHSSYEVLDIIGCHYGTDKKTDTAGTINDEECEEFVSRFLMPLCVENGKTLSLEQICKNMSMVTFCTHCYGAVAVDKIINQLSKNLVSLGLSQKDINNIKSHLCQISYSALIDSAVVPTVRIESMTDSFHHGLAEKFKKVYGHNLNGVEIKYDKAGMFRGEPCKDPNSCEMLHIFTSKLLNLEDNRDMSKLIDEHTIDYLGREDNWTITEKSRNAKNADLVSMMMAYAISWAVAKSLKAHSLNKSQKRTNLNKGLAQDLMEIKETYSDSELIM